MLKLLSSGKLLSSLLVLTPFLTGCLEKDPIAYIPDAENLLFTDSGELIITGGKDVYQLIATQQAGETNYETRVISPESISGKCNYTGLAQSGDWVFTTCVELKWLFIRNNHLLAANLTDPYFRFRFVTSPSDTNDPLDDSFIPNGMDFAPDGALLVADENFFATSGVDRIGLNIPDAASYAVDNSLQPELLTFEKDWLSAANDVHSANGLKVDGQYLFITEGGKVKRFEFNSEGEIPPLKTFPDGSVSTNTGKVLWENTLAILDDLIPFCGGVAFTSFIDGSLHYVATYQDDAGNEYFPEIYATLPFAYANPSALAIGAGQGFSGEDLLVTEKGLLFNHAASYGNHLIRSPLTENLNDPDICLMIEEQARQQLVEEGRI